MIRLVKSHYVPQLILRHFGTDERIQYCDLDKKKVETRNIKSAFAEKGYYPETIDSEEVLPWIDPNLFTDPAGIPLWDEDSNYVYEATNCEEAKCKSYTLRAQMEKEEAYIKTSRN